MGPTFFTNLSTCRVSHGLAPRANKISHLKDCFVIGEASFTRLIVFFFASIRESNIFFLKLFGPSIIPKFLLMGYQMINILK